MLDVMRMFERLLRNAARMTNYASLTFQAATVALVFVHSRPQMIDDVQDAQGNTDIDTSKGNAATTCYNLCDQQVLIGTKMFCE